MKFGSGRCEGRVSTAVSSVLGKQRCGAGARYFIAGKNLCTRCTTKAKANAYGRLIQCVKDRAKKPEGGNERALLRELGED